jgi:hypothetical protein
MMLVCPGWISCLQSRRGFVIRYPWGLEMTASVNQQPEAALRRSLMRVKPEYFSWPKEEQEKYRVHLPDEDDFRLRKSVINELWGIQVDNPEQMAAVVQDFDKEQSLLFNSAMLPVMGIGEDYFFLNEYFSDGKTILDYETLDDYCAEDHVFQEEARQKQDSTYIKRPYRGNLFGRWARLMVDDCFQYATLTSLAAYLHDEIDKTGSERMEQLIPHKYVCGRNHGKPEASGFLLDYQLDAQGKERYLEELKRRFWGYQDVRYHALLEEFDQQAQGCVYRFPDVESKEPYLVFVFSDKTALRAVRLCRFMSDYQKIPGRMEDLQALQIREKAASVEFVEAQYQDLMANFDPKVSRLRKRRKVILSKAALDDLSIL